MFEALKITPGTNRLHQMRWQNETRTHIETKTLIFWGGGAKCWWGVVVVGGGVAGGDGSDVWWKFML